MISLPGPEGSPPQSLTQWTQHERMQFTAIDKARDFAYKYFCSTSSELVQARKCLRYMEAIGVNEAFPEYVAMVKKEKLISLSWELIFSNLQVCLAIRLHEILREIPLVQRRIDQLYEEFGTGSGCPGYAMAFEIQQPLWNKVEDLSTCIPLAHHVQPSKDTVRSEILGRVQQVASTIEPIKAQLTKVDENLRMRTLEQMETQRRIEWMQSEGVGSTYGPLKTAIMQEAQLKKSINGLKSEKAKLEKRLQNINDHITDTNLLLS